MKAVIYCRVSTEEQANAGLSLDIQEKTCREAATREGYAVSEVIKDEGKSAGSLNRPGIRRIQQLVEEKQINAVFMTNNDRLARNLADHIAITSFLEENGVKIYFLNMLGIDRSTASGYFSDSVLAAVSEHHRRLTSEKTKNAMAAKVREGWIPGPALIGYKNVDNPNYRQDEISRRVIVPDPEMAPLVTEAFKLYATGNYNGYELNEMMYQKGLRTKRGNKLHPNILYTMLAKSFYAGELHYGGMHFAKGKHQPLIDKDSFDRVQAVLASHNHYATRRRKHQFLLRGLVRCAEHRNKRYTAEWHNKKSGLRFAYYHCVNRSGCAGQYVKTDFLEDGVAMLFKNLTFSKSFIERVVSKAKNKFEAHRKEHESRVKTLQAQKARLVAKRTVVENKLFNNVLSDEDFTRVKKEIGTDLAVVDDQIAKLDSQREIKVDIAQEIMRFTRDLFNAYLKADPIVKRHYLLLFFKDIYAYKGEVQEVKYSELFEELLKLKEITLNKPSDSVSSGIIRGKLLALLKDFRTLDWAEEYKYPTVILSQMKELLAEQQAG